MLAQIMGLFDAFKKKNKTRRVLKLGSISLILPQGWREDTSDSRVLSIYREKGDSGVFSISTFTKDDGKAIDPKKALSNLILKDKKIKIKTYERNNTNYALSDYYIKEDRFWRAMVADSDKKHSLVTYNIEEKFKNAYLSDVDEIFNSFMLN